MKNMIRIMMLCCVLTASFALSGCGSGGGGAQNSGVTPSVPPAAGNSYTPLADTYGLQTATFLYTESNNTGGFVLRAAIAERMTVTNPADIFRIDILLPSQISLTGTNTYYLGESAANGTPFPGSIRFFNGEESTLLRTVSGEITFTKFGTTSGSEVEGSFNVTLADDKPASPYHVGGTFHYVLNL